MKPLPYLLAALILGQLAAECFSQDTAAPVVESSGGLVANISCPTRVQAGNVLVLDVSGTSEGQTELIIRPAVAPGAVQWDSDGRHVYLWIARTGHFVALWVVSAGSDIEADAAAFEVVPHGDDPPEDDDPPIDPPDGDDGDDPPDEPADPALAAYVRELTEAVDADDHAEVAQIFREVADEIAAGKHPNSTAVQTATLDRLFGTDKPRTGRPEWWEWWKAIIEYTLNVRELDTHEFAAAYRVIAKETKP